MGPATRSERPTLHKNNGTTMKFEVETVKEDSFYALGTLKDSWVLTAKQFFPLFIGWFVTLGLPLIIIGVGTLSGIFADKALGFAKGGPFTLMALLFGVAAIGSMWAGWAKVTLNISRGIPARFHDLLCSPGQIVAGLIACAITATLIGIGSWLIIPGALLFLKWQLVPYFIVDQNCGPIDAMRRSWHATDGKIFIPLAVLDLIFVGLSTVSGAIIVGPVLCHMALAVASAIVYSKWLTDEDAPFNRPDMIEDHDLR